MLKFSRNILLKFPSHFTSLILISLCLAFQVQAQDVEKEPIAYIGHGAFFDHDGKQIVLTLEFAAKAQDWYRTKLLSSLKDDKKAEFKKLEERLHAGAKVEGQARLVMQQHLIDWLVANSDQLKDDHRTLGKLRALKYALQWKLPDHANLEQFQFGEEFKIDSGLENKLKLLEFKPGGVQVLSATMNQGQAYINECRAAGVPIPPPIGRMDSAGLTGWKSQGFIPTDKQFIGQEMGPSPAEVRTFKSLSPPGMCIALPRYTDDSLTTVRLDGVICLGQTSSKVCFWDNQMNGVSFSFPAGTQIPIGLPDLSINPAGQYQAGGFELVGSAGGECTDCHAGQNPYIIHPRADLGGGKLMGNLGDPPENLPMFSAARYDPLVRGTWWQNQLSHSPTLVPAGCKSCHIAGGPGGAFPHLSSSSELQGYCNTILSQAIEETMPPSAPGSLKNDPAVIAFKNWCNSAASSGPSNRGDPHITSFNGINFDFQGAGEFVALRDGDDFEIQTRQTPVATETVIGPNSHTGLTSCVSINTAVAVRVGKHRVTYQPHLSGEPDPKGLQLRVDGKLTMLGEGGVDLGTDGRIVKSSVGSGIEIDFSNKTRLIVTPGWWGAPQNKWYLNLDIVNTSAREGIMGAILPGNWLPLLPDGTSMGVMPNSLDQRYVDLNQRFADAWRVSEGTSLFHYALDTSTDTFTMNNWPPENPPCVIPESQIPPAKPMDKSRAEKLCSRIFDKNMREECVFDVTVTGEASFAETYLLTQQLHPGATRITVKGDKELTKHGENVTFTATVAQTRADTSSTPTGMVQFNLDAIKVGNPVMLDADGLAVWSTASLQIGKHAISADYIPKDDSVFRASSSPDENHTVIVIDVLDQYYWFAIIILLIAILVLIGWVVLRKR